MNRPPSSGRRGRHSIGGASERGLGCPGPAEPAAGFLRSAAPWTKPAAPGGPVLRLTPPRLVRGPPQGGFLGRWGSQSCRWGGVSVFLTGHPRPPGRRARFSRLGYFPGPRGTGSAGSVGDRRWAGTERATGDNPRLEGSSPHRGPSCLDAPRVRPAPPGALTR